jgi:preprotein translocase subunit SecE
VSGSPSATSPGARGAGKTDATRRGFFATIALFVRQVVAELKKVVRPTRQELFTYIGVVVVFVLVVMAFVGVLDLGFGRLVLWAFG